MNKMDGQINPSNVFFPYVDFDGVLSKVYDILNITMCLFAFSSLSL